MYAITSWINPLNCKIKMKTMVNYLIYNIEGTWKGKQAVSKRTTQWIVYKHSVDLKLPFVVTKKFVESKTFNREVWHMEYFLALFFKQCAVHKLTNLNSWLATEISTGVNESTLSWQMIIVKWTGSSLIAFNSSCRNFPSQDSLIVNLKFH